MKSTTKRRIAMGLALIALPLSTAACASTPNSGETGVVRNGGPFDNKNIRQIIPNGAGNTWTGFGSTTHYYPVSTQQRFYKAEACFGQDGCTADRGPYKVQTKDGVDLGIEGTAYLNTTFDGSPKGIKALKSFDTQFATRTFNGDHVYEGNRGFSNFLAALVDPIASNNLRDVASGLECAQFVSSCALVQNQDPTKLKTDDLANKNNQSNVKTVQDAVSTGLAADLLTNLGGGERIVYFNNIKFVITKVDLPVKVQNAVNDTQASFAEVSKVQAKVAQAKAQVNVQHQNYLANVEKQKGYNSCHSCQIQDEYKALPGGLQTYAPGAAFAVTGK